MPLIDTVLGMIAPHECLACGSQGSLLCRWCQTEHLLPFEATPPVHALDNLWIRTVYTDVAKQLLHRFKFERARAAATTIADVMNEALPFLPRPIIVVPIPTATSRMRTRGYDHAVLLARHIAHQQGLLDGRLLTRLTQTRQVGASRSQRLTQLAGAFQVTHPKLASGAHILLIDDVLTTGSTLHEAANTFRNAGAASVSALVFAYKSPPNSLIEDNNVGTM